MEQRLIDALDSIRGGADIYARHIAMQLREIQKLHPEYINICKPMAYEGDGSDQVPFFGAIATPAGIEFLDVENAFDSESARLAQKYCEESRAPHFAPLDGICFRCKRIFTHAWIMEFRSLVFQYVAQVLNWLLVALTATVVIAIRKGPHKAGQSTGFTSRRRVTGEPPQ